MFYLEPLSLCTEFAEQLNQSLESLGHPPLSRTQKLWLSICITGIIGDLTQSFLKRNAKVKNSGKIIPGHGGVFDRMDSMIFSAPFYYLIIN